MTGNAITVKPGETLLIVGVAAEPQPPLGIWGPGDPRPTLPIAGWDPGSGTWPTPPQPPLGIWGPGDPRPTLPIAGWNPGTGTFPPFPIEPPTEPPPTTAPDGNWTWAWSPQLGRWVWVKVPGEGEAGPKTT